MRRLLIRFRPARLRVVGHFKELIVFVMIARMAEMNLLAHVRINARQKLVKVHTVGSLELLAERLRSVAFALTAVRNMSQDL